MEERPFRFARLCLAACLIVQTAGCASWIGEVPSELRVDTGMDPDKQDEYVRFRTTYYFRVVDSCRVEKNAEDSNYEYRLGVLKNRTRGMHKIVNDALYRFRMTGQSSALFNQVRFESGVLRAEQIDPFGSTVALDKRSGTFRVESASTGRVRAQKDEVYAEIYRLKALSRSFTTDQALTDKQVEDLRSNVAALIQQQLLFLAESNNLPADAERKDAIGKKDQTAGQEVLCPDGRPAIQSYYLYGPEGVRELDPDERLLMAMASDGKPVITLLQQLSGKKLRQPAGESGTAKALLNERLWVLDSIRILNDAGERPLNELLEEIVKAPGEELK